MSIKQDSVFSLTTDERGIGWLTIDVPGETQNTLRQEFIDEICILLTDIESNKQIKALVLISGKETNFVAGADISMLESIASAEEAEQLSKKGHEIFNRLENLKMPVIAAIHGACLGGGLELAMACSHRISSDDKLTKLGLPEVQLGVLPGGGGTQRLPRLIGIAAALDMMLTGRQLIAKQAKKLGLIDEVVPLTNLRKAAEKLAFSQMGKTRRKSIDARVEIKPASLLKFAELQKLVLETSSFGRSIIFDKALQTVNKKTRGNYPAPEKIIECVRTGMEEGVQAGLSVEAKLFGELVVSPESKQLMNIFFATTELKKDSGVEQPVEVKNFQRIGVLGGGLMGAGIAFVSLDKAQKRVRLKDTGEQGINHALRYCWNIYRQRVKKKRMSISDASRQFAGLSGTTNYRGFKKVDLVIEAVFENLELKQQMVKEVEAVCEDNMIFASNTSSIPITEIAKASLRPERVIGLHYFSPVERMPLLEVVITEKTDPDVIASCVEFGKQQGKTVIVVKDGTGFYTSRILGPFVNEAGHLIAEGVAIDKIDNALQDAGFPIGPITLLDEVGIDVGTKIAPILVAEFGERMAPPAIFSKLAEDNRKGKKNKRGFYLYSSSKKSSKKVDESIYTLLNVRPTNEMMASEIVNRCMLQMINEAVLCLQDGILKSARDGDIGAIFGLGFPPFLGGPFRYVDAIGAKGIVQQLRELEQKYGSRFAPATMLIKMSEKEESFYS
ncbi:fatty acid oxidation complex subunit alpha FadJ [Aliikangiella sp. IMCC44359]|uniref:fatty acid oxidation complex subunit alpha FadJ n=1 Tax=Aliikangiella sp. IMCC44359 TaxID=3459125 RepID=UPI00403AF05D